MLLVIASESKVRIGSLPGLQILGQEIWTPPRTTDPGEAQPYPLSQSRVSSAILSVHPADTSFSPWVADAGTDENTSRQTSA